LIVELERWRLMRLKRCDALLAGGSPKLLVDWRSVSERTRPRQFGQWS
jgi:hypothetical protein